MPDSSTKPTETRSAAAAPTSSGAGAIPRRWTHHRLNSGLIFGLTVRGVRTLPRTVSYAIGHAGTWLAWRLMAETNAAVSDNLRAVMPGASDDELRRHALETYRSYAYSTIDFLRAASADDRQAAATFDIRPEDRATFEGVLARGKGGLLVTGHYGTWEIGGLLMRVLGLPLTVVAMLEADPEVNRLRRETRAQMGVETLEVRQALETALQIRRLLGQNRLVALLIDRHLGRDRVQVTHFGRPAYFLQTPALMAYLSGAPLIPCFVERIGPGRFRTFAADAIDVDRHLEREEAIRQATQRVADAIEARVRVNPHAWYHFYRYWDAQDGVYHGLE
ncbi:MAG TPA: lysophospholipid acyltransferase family protein [Vicinamibacterales bacterium]|nr:lysophospholipid acyltransferase family protein [Vicinamibacterales bacterium]